MRKFKFGNFQIPANAGYKEMIEVILINQLDSDMQRTAIFEYVEQPVIVTAVLETGLRILQVHFDQEY